jgi:[protein-PII] uridylyltransferase
LLYDLTRSLGGLNLNIASAHVATFGERAVDVFYITDLTGGKIVAKARQGAIVRHLIEAAGTPGTVAAKPAGEKAVAVS